MTHRLRVGGLLLVALVSAGADLAACGDKFLILGRGTRFQRAGAARAEAAILVYANPSSNLDKALSNVKIESVLKKAGYKPHTVTSAADLDSALGRGGWDLVLVDVVDGASLRSRIEPKAIVLPVIYNASSDELAQAKRQYPRILRSPTKNQAFLDVIDDALALKAKTKSRASAGND